MIRVLLLATAVVLATGAAMSGQQAGVFFGSEAQVVVQAPGLPPRDVAQQRTGTGRIRGRIVAATGQPIRRAQVMVNGPMSRVVTTDADGRYEVAGLPAGSFFVSAVKPGYVRLQYGQRRPFDAGTSVAVADGQIVDRIDLALPRGSVIAVRLTDEFGEPALGAQIQVQRYQYSPDGQRRLTFAPMAGPGPTFTDDRGEFRAFGLAPGEYVVSATIRSQLTGMPGAADVFEGYAPTFYPGTASAELAQAVSVGVGEEVSIHFAMVASRLARISGTVSDSQGRAVAGVSLQLSTRQGGGISSTGGGMTSPDGTFAIGGVAPGDYTIDVRPIPRAGVRFVEVEGEFASVPVTVGGSDITGVRVVTGPGTTVSGRVVFDGTARLPTTPVRVFLQQSEPGSTMFFPPSQDPARNGTLGIDNRFQITNTAGRVFFQFAAGGWVMKSVTLDGREIVDEPLDLTGKASVSDVVITMTDRISGLSGQVSDAAGPVKRIATIVAMPADPMDPATTGRLTRMLRSNPEGRFQLRGIRPGRYVIAAVDSIEEGRQFAPEFRQQLRKAGREFTVREGESVTVDLRISPDL